MRGSRDSIGLLLDGWAQQVNQIPALDYTTPTATITCVATCSGSFTDTSTDVSTMTCSAGVSGSFLDGSLDIATFTCFGTCSGTFTAGKLVTATMTGAGTCSGSFTDGTTDRADLTCGGSVSGSFGASASKVTTITCSAGVTGGFHQPFFGSDMTCVAGVIGEFIGQEDRSWLGASAGGGGSYYQVPPKLPAPMVPTLKVPTEAERRAADAAFHANIDAAFDQAFQDVMEDMGPMIVRRVMEATRALWELHLAQATAGLKARAAVDEDSEWKDQLQGTFGKFSSGQKLQEDWSADLRGAFESFKTGAMLQQERDRIQREEDELREEIRQAMAKGIRRGKFLRK